MKVKVTYPPNFPLLGWDKALFGIRLKNLFGRNYFSICAVDACGEALGKTFAHKGLRADLNELHCMDYKKMPPAVREQLPPKVGELLGVRIESVPGWHVRWTTVALMAVLLATIGTGAVVLNVAGAKKVEAATIGLPEALPSPVMGMPIIAANSWRDPSTVYKATVTTADAGKTIAYAAQAVKAVAPRGKRFDVMVIVSPVEDDATADVPIVSADENRDH